MNIYKKITRWNALFQSTLFNRSVTILIKIIDSRLDTTNLLLLDLLNRRPRYKKKANRDVYGPNVFHFFSKPQYCNSPDFGHNNLEFMAKYIKLECSFSWRVNYVYTKNVDINFSSVFLRLKITYLNWKQWCLIYLNMQISCCSKLQYTAQFVSVFTIGYFTYIFCCVFI